MKYRPFLLIAAFIVFAVAFFGVAPGGANMVVLGLALWVAAEIAATVYPQ